MSYYSGQQAAADHERELASIPRDLDLYAHVEGLVGEENELMEEAEEGHKEEKRERLHAIRTELDRAWETLRQRAERHGKPVS